MTRFQKFLIGVPHVVVLLLIVINTKGLRMLDLNEAGYGLLFYLLFFIAVPLVLAVFLYFMLSEKISFTGSYIICSWLLYLGLIGYAGYAIIHDKPATMENEKEFKVTYSGEENLVDSLARNYAKYTVLQNTQYKYMFQKIHPIRNLSGEYAAQYFYTEKGKEDTADIKAVRMRLNAKGNISFSEISANRDSLFLKDFLFYMQINKMLPAFAKLQNGTIDESLANVLKENMMDTIDLEQLHSE